jgi:hypothetical protein
MGTSFHASFARKLGRAYVWKKVLEQVCPYRGPTEGPGEGGPSTRNFGRWMKGTLGIRQLSLKRLTVEDLQGGLLYCLPWVMKGRLWGWAFLIMGAQLDKLGLSTGDFERWLKRALGWSVSL